MESVSAAHGYALCFLHRFLGVFLLVNAVKVTIPIVGLSFDAAALYDQKEAKVSVNDAETTMTQKSLNIPVNVRYGFGLSSLANVFVFAGPQWGINVGDKNFKWNDNSSYSLKKSNFSVNVGLGVTLLSHLAQLENQRLHTRFVVKARFGQNFLHKRGCLVAKPKETVVRSFTIEIL